MLPLAPAAQSNDEILQAIAAGKNKKQAALMASCDAKPGLGEAMAGGMGGGLRPTGRYNVAVAGPLGHVASLAFEASRLYKSFGLADVTDDMRSPTIYVTAAPDDPRRAGNSYSVASPIQSIVLTSKDNGGAALSTDLRLEPVVWKNLLGASFSGTSATATFSREEVDALPAGELNIVLVTAAGERRCKIGASERAKVLGK